MEKFNCEFFTLAIKFSESNFKKKEFLGDVKEDEEGINESRYYYGSKSNEGKDHAHLDIFFDKKDSMMAISYHQGKTPSEDVREPYLEDCAKWLTQFFKKKSVTVDYTAVFRYGKAFDSIVPLDYPLLSSNKNLKGVTVAGYQLEFPKEALIDTAFITEKKGNKLVILSAEIKNLDLLERDFYSNLEDFSKIAKSLVTNKGAK